MDIIIHVCRDKYTTRNKLQYMYVQENSLSTLSQVINSGILLQERVE